MVDVDVVKLLPDAFDDLQQNFKLSGILPGGSHCMMNAVSVSDIHKPVGIIFSCSSSHVHHASVTKFGRSMRVEGLSWAQICISLHRHHSLIFIKMATYVVAFDCDCINQ